MTLRELLSRNTGKAAYFYYDRKGLDPQKMTISGTIAARLQSDNTPLERGINWHTGAFHHNKRDVVHVNLAGNSGPYLTLVRVV